MEPTKLIDALDFLVSYIMNPEFNFEEKYEKTPYKSNFEEKYENVDTNSNWEGNF